MPTVTGTFQFPSVIPEFLFSKEAKDGRGVKEESNTIVFFLKKKQYICICLCVCILCIIL